CISIPTHRDKITLKALSKVLKLYFPYIKQPLVHSVISKLISEIKSGKYTYFIKLDISSFYDNIDHKLLLKKITDYIDDSLIIDLVNKAIKNPIHPETRENKVGVHQGLSVSNFLAEIYMSEIDMKYSEIKDIFYIRYVDDIIILCNY